MTRIAAAAAFLFLSPLLQADREGATASVGATAGSALEALFQNPVPERHQEIAKQCKGVQEKYDAAPVSVEKMEKCVNALASFAQMTQMQRKKSLTANKNYHDDVLLAKKILRFLTNNIASDEVNYNKYRAEKAQRLREVEAALTKGNSLFQQSGIAGAANYLRPDNPGGMGQGSLMSMETRQVPTMHFQAGSQRPDNLGGMSQGSLMAMETRQVPMMNYQAAMLTPTGQNFGLPPSLVGRRPSLLQLGNTAASGGLQARLDREAESLEAAEAEDMRGGGSDADS